MTQPALVSVTPLDVPHLRCMQGVYEALRAVPLPGMQQDSSGAPKDWLMLQIWADTRTIPPMPCTVVTIDGLTEKELNDEDGTEVSTVEYPVNVLLLNREPWEDHTYLNRWLLWRHNAMNVFRSMTRMPQVQECVNVRCEPKPILEPNRMTPKGEGGQPFQSKMSGFSVWCYCTLNSDKERQNP